MWLYTQPNPLDKSTGDCVIRAIAIITESTWERAYMDLCAEGLLLADLPNSNAVWGSYLRKFGYKRKAIDNTCPDCYTIDDFCKDHPFGEYVVCTGSHVAAVMDGNVYDAWDSRNEIPAYYYYKEEE